MGSPAGQRLDGKFIFLPSNSVLLLSLGTVSLVLKGRRALLTKVLCVVFQSKLVTRRDGTCRLLWLFPHLLECFRMWVK